MANLIISTKLHAPAARPGLIPRPSLLSLLDTALTRSLPLVVVSAPAGYGKTTAAAEWLRRGNLRGAWLSLDGMDNDPVRFWRHFTAALQKAEPSVGRALQPFFEASQAPPADFLAAVLADDLAETAGPIAVVLDDYHVVNSDVINSAMDALLDRIPPSLVVVITARSEPPLSLARLRARGRLLEVRWDDLRFSAQEVDALFNGNLGLGLPEHVIDALYRRTEGWAAGLQLAALSVQRYDDPETFARLFAGDDRYVADYLLQEVLDRQTPQVRSFLLKTSILERLCGSLCDNVTDQGNSREFLTYLEESNLFLIPLDNRRHWYRYHHLFADLLRKRLHTAEGPDAVEALYRRACAWHEGEGMIEEAVSLAMASSRPHLAAEFLERHILTLFFRCDYSTVQRWLEGLGTENLRAHPLLCAMYANILSHAGSFRPKSLQQAKAWLDEAAGGLEDAEPGPGEPGLTRGFIALSYAYLALWQKETPETVVKLVLQALSSLPTLDGKPLDQSYLRLYSGLYCNLGMSYLNMGDIEKAAEALDRARQIAETCGDLLNAYTAVAYKCGILRRQGRLGEAADLCRQALASIDRDTDGSAPATPFSAETYIALAGIYIEWNDLDSAKAQLDKGIRLSRAAAGIHPGLTADLASARLLAARGDVSGALSVLEQSQRQHPEAYDVIQAHRTRILLLCRNRNSSQMDAIARWAARNSFDDISEFEGMVLARAVIALRQAGGPFAGNFAAPAGYGSFLEKSILAAEAGGETERLIELLIIDSMAKWADSDQPRALSALGRSLSLARPGGYVRMYVDEGLPMQTLISAFIGRYKRQAGNAQPLKEMRRPEVEYAVKLLSCFSPFEGVAGARNLLFPRELEVLRMAVDGASNAQIARKLFISVNTVKKHLTNIYGKIGAANRREAADRARDLGLFR